MRIVEINFVGPFGWSAKESIPLVYDSRMAAERSGVYLHTILTADGDELVCYVGETGRSFWRRFQEEEISLLDGSERIFDPDRYVRGEKVRLWGGKWARYRETGQDSDLRFRRLEPLVIRFKDIHRLHMAPISEGNTGTLELKEFRLRAEAAPAHHFYKQGGIVGGFQDEDVEYLNGSSLPRVRLEKLNWPPSDAKNEIQFRAECAIRGFPTHPVRV